MADILLFLIRSLLTGALFFSFYELFMRKETYLKFNRIYLLLSAFLMIALPLLGYLVPFNLPVQGAKAPLAVVTLPEVVITSSRILSAEQQQSIVDGALLSYGVITAAMLAGLVLSISRIARFYRSAIKAEKMENNIFLFAGKGSPFSFLGKIFIPASYAEHPHLKNILVHENAHIRQRHLADLILLELLSSIFWFNPFFFLIKRAMREVHEYLADREVIRQGTEALDYQQLLYNEVSGSPQYIIANNFNLLIKKRIVMLVKKSRKSAALRIAILVPFLLAASLFVGITGVKSVLGQEALAPVPDVPPPPPALAELPVPPVPPVPPAPPAIPAKLNKVSAPAPVAQVTPLVDIPEGDTTKKGKQNEVFTVVEKMPEYVGGQSAMMDYLVKSIKYPEEARKKGVVGTVFVSFIVEADGTVTNAKVIRGIGGGCDEEAWRVIKEMPKWTPGTQKGKPVRVQFNLPIKFSLDEKKGEKKSK